MVRPRPLIVLRSAAMLAALPLAIGAAPPDRLKRNIEIDGYRVQVMVKGGHARAHQLGMFKYHRTSPEMREVLIKATKQVTGCDMREPYFQDMFLIGMLDCPPGP